MMSATASLGMSMLWDSDVGVSQVDKYSYSAEEHIKVRTSSSSTDFALCSGTDEQFCRLVLCLLSVSFMLVFEESWTLRMPCWRSTWRTKVWS
jgi:hypothetical protein